MSRAKGCVFRTVNERFDQEDTTALNHLLKTRGYLAVAREMTNAGFPMSEHTVRRHFKGDCTCHLVAA